MRTNLVRLNGRALRGERVIQRSTWSVADHHLCGRPLRRDQMTAPMVVEGAMTGEMFLAYVVQCLVPTLKRNDIVVMDNCRIHFGPGIRAAIEKVHATLRYLPKYSPTSTRSRWPTANSRHSSARSQRELFRASIEQFARLSRSSAHKNVPTISCMQAMLQDDRICCRAQLGRPRSMARCAAEVVS